MTALLEQERPNIFTQSVANILPGNEVEITLEYVETLAYEKSVYEFVFPDWLVGPRYNPARITTRRGSCPRADAWAGTACTTTRPSWVPVSATPSAFFLRYLPPTVRSGHDIELSLATGTPAVPIESISEPHSPNRTDAAAPATNRAHGWTFTPPTRSRTRTWWCDVAWAETVPELGRGGIPQR